MSATGTRTERGFTLLELLVVLAILGTVSAFAATAWGGRDERLRRLALAQLQAQLAAARQAASAQGVTVVFPLPPNARWTPEPRRSGAPASPRFFGDGTASPGRIELDSGGPGAVLHIHWAGHVTEYALGL